MAVATTGWSIMIHWISKADLFTIVQAPSFTSLDKLRRAAKGMLLRDGISLSATEGNCHIYERGNYKTIA